ncbi:MAG: WYL domain-containing protein [Coriobacteriaceae bacterium]|nr:WYL domain-containing protein [Coriobacteriaceae bacterium]
MPETMSSATATATSDEKESRDERTIRRLLNLLFAFNVATAPLSTEEIIANPEIGYTGATYESNVRAFNRDRKTLAEHGVFIQENKRCGDAKNEHRSWSLDRMLTHAAPHLVSRYDAESVLAAIDQVLSIQNADPSHLALQSARLKLSEMAGAPQSAGPTASTLSNPDVPRETLEAVWSSFNSRRPVRFTYSNRMGDERTHTVDIYGLFMRGCTSYIVGFDHDAQSLRTFRTDRILSAKAGAASGKTYRIPTDFDVSSLQFLPFDFSPAEPVEGTLSFPPNIGEGEIALVAKGRGSLERLPDRSWLWHVDIHDLEAAASFVLSNASCGMRAVQPQSLCDRVRSCISKAVRAHE